MTRIPASHPTGRATASGVDFAYLEAGPADGPLGLEHPQIVNLRIVEFLTRS